MTSAMEISKPIFSQKCLNPCQGFWVTNYLHLYAHTNVECLLFPRSHTFLGNKAIQERHPLRWVFVGFMFGGALFSHYQVNPGKKPKRCHG